jgi:hypothetical protein
LENAGLRGKMPMARAAAPGCLIAMTPPWLAVYQPLIYRVRRLSRSYERQTPMVAGLHFFVLGILMLGVPQPSFKSLREGRVLEDVPLPSPVLGVGKYAKPAPSFHYRFPELSHLRGGGD